MLQLIQILVCKILQIDVFNFKAQNNKMIQQKILYLIT